MTPEEQERERRQILKMFGFDPDDPSYTVEFVDHVPVVTAKTEALREEAIRLAEEAGMLEHDRNVTATETPDEAFEKFWLTTLQVIRELCKASFDAGYRAGRDR